MGKARIVELTWPMTLKSGNWWDGGVDGKARAERHTLTSRQRAFATACVKSQSGCLPPGPWTITLTRLYGLKSHFKHERKWDGDNVSRGFKAVRDGIADALGVNDGDETAATWQYGQEKATRSGVRIKIETRR